MIKPLPTDAELAEQAARNVARAKVAIERMGKRYVCHPANQIKPTSVTPVLDRPRSDFVAPTPLLRLAR